MVYMMGFSHSEISGSKVAGHLPEAYRRQTASFIAFFSQGIHHTPLLRIPVKEFQEPRIWFYFTLYGQSNLSLYKNDKTLSFSCIYGGDFEPP